MATALICALFLVACLSSNQSNSVEVPDKMPRSSRLLEEVRAVSLKVLQSKLRVCQPENACSPELLELAGLNTVLGFVIDQTNQDLILLGQRDPGLPPLYLEDFVIALRNAWMKYASLEGNVYQYSYPGCSIDPVPEVMRELQSVEQQLASRRSPDEIESAIDNWRRSCEKPQVVRVLGIPFDTHFAKVMVDADYDMKTLADGTDAIGIPGFISMMDMSLREARRAILQKQPVRLSAGLNRFWFYPGETVCEEGQGVFLIKQCPVRLLTEEMHSNARGQTIQSGRANPRAKRFAENFSALYTRVARQRPIYLELENLFRFTVLAKLIKNQNATAFDLSHLLEDFVVASTSVSESLDGRHAIQNLEHRDENQHGVSILRLWFPSCGGVSIDMNPKVERDPTGQLVTLGGEVIKNRPSPEALSWDFKDSTFALSEKKENARLLVINQANKTNHVLTVIYKPEGYVIYNGESEPLYSGSDLTESGKRLQAKYGTSSIENFWIDFKNFPPGNHKEEAFLSTYRIQNPKSKTQGAVEPLPTRQDGSTVNQDQLLLAGLTLNDNESKIEQVVEGKHKGWVKVTLSFLVQVGKEVHRVIVTFFIRGLEHVKNMDLAQAFRTEVAIYFSDPALKAESLLDSINEIKRIFKRKYSDAEVEVEIEGTRISHFAPAMAQDVIS